jgi:hypothetical protein
MIAIPRQRVGKFKIRGNAKQQNLSKMTFLKGLLKAVNHIL